MFPTLVYVFQSFHTLCFPRTSNTYFFLCLFMNLFIVCPKFRTFSHIWSKFSHRFPKCVLFFEFSRIFSHRIPQVFPMYFPKISHRFPGSFPICFPHLLPTFPIFFPGFPIFFTNFFPTFLPTFLPTTNTGAAEDGTGLSSAATRGDRRWSPSPWAARPQIPGPGTKWEAWNEVRCPSSLAFSWFITHDGSVCMVDWC